MKNISILRKVLIIIGLLGVIYSIALCLVINFNFGIIESLVLSIVILCYGFFWNELIKLKVLTYIIWFGAMVCSCFVIFLYIYGHNNNITYNENAMIVLGGGVHGSVVSATLAKRLDNAVKYHNDNGEGIIVVSGGQGPQENITEALAMKLYLLKRNVPDNLIIMEDKSSNTLENFKYSKKILDNYFQKPYSVCFSTSDFHVFRATQTAKLVGLTCTHIYAKTAFYDTPVNYFRELASVCKFIFVSITYKN